MKLILVLLTLVPAMCAARDNPFLRELPIGGKLELTLEDKLRLPAFAWPRTLLDYSVKFGTPPKADNLRLRDIVTGKDVAFQLSDVRGNFAVVSFFADLPSGGVRRYELSAGPATAMPAGVSQSTDGQTILLDSGKLKVRIPASQPVGGKVPGPVLEVNGVGDSTLSSPRRKVVSLRTESVESGPLFVSFRVTYQFEGGGEYRAVVKVVAGYDHVRISEEMLDLVKEDGIHVENAWKNFHPTHRMVVGSPFGGTHKIGEPIVQPFRGEDPAFTGPTRIEDPAVEMLPSLTPYWPNGWGGNRSASFWDEKTGEALGLFVTDASKWQDHEYAVWTSAETLKVKYRYVGGVLYWTWPLVTGTRETGITAYRHEVAQLPKPLAGQAGDATGQEQDPEEDGGKEHPVVLQIFHGDISLDRVKDWVLEYPDTAKRAPLGAMPPGRRKSVEDYFKNLPECAMTAVARGMFHPVGLRDMTYWVVPDFLRFRDEMTPAQRSQATAALLFASYVSAADEYAPMRTMLGGHPNFMADLKFPMAAGAVLFPDHPMASEWREQYAKFLELCGDFYVRPAVPEWDSRGGRFTESIATYNWAFMAPTSEANRLSMMSGGRNFYATPQMADMGDYLTGILTAPQSADNHGPERSVPQTWENGYKRIHPPQGAHSSKRGAGGPMYVIGGQLLNYRPLTGEHMMWGAFPAAGKGFENRGDHPVAMINRGTNPHLASAKYTGYGIVLRAGVDTPDEISVYLQQVDKGPNYRWGYANQNGSGDIYYYAGGKSYSGHEREEAGDGHVDDALFTSNTGVYKDYHFKSIGMNELTRPLYNLESAQFAEIVPQSGVGAYSWPEYQSRSVMLVGTDYIITHDNILEGCGTRFAWNISRDDEMPFIQSIKGSNGFVNLTDPKDGFIRGRMSTMIKGGGSQMALVTHKAEVRILPNKRVKGMPPLPYVRVKSPGGEDFVFEGDGEIHYDDGKMAFTGTAGVIRNRKGGRTEIALFHGSRIAAGGVGLTVDHADLGISASFDSPSEITGNFYSREGGTFVLDAPKGGKFYVDGTAASYRLPPGGHRWEYTSRLPEPMPPLMLRAENRKSGGTVFFSKVAGAEKYRVELSQDNGVTWRSVGVTADDHLPLTGLSDGIKVHLRVIALNNERESRPAAEYPLYVTKDAPLPPDGLKTDIREGHVDITWGEVLGVTEYRLYRRIRGESAWKEIFRGLAHQYADKVKVPPPFSDPGLRAAVMDSKATRIIEYAVSATNGNGEGARSLTADTDPRSWLNWSPGPDLRYKRQSAFWLPPYVLPQEVPPPHYPQ